ncbi:hypothetical protein M501DRAFT_997723 [Patellaria atrata CBS 101060]|uniref:JmjC domain-containing histone demethylation protein 1 n=1 Tax=Patellaria atrata CBS 101060 TaxID=1346257 RepID=A0A9P4S3N5_9PEZI|nr:hypothetical protein M501DRAFT_997723 [Patellaria atrata CBS 101060]
MPSFKREFIGTLRSFDEPSPVYEPNSPTLPVNPSLTSGGPNTTNALRQFNHYQSLESIRQARFPSAESEVDLINQNHSIQHGTTGIHSQSARQTQIHGSPMNQLADIALATSPTFEPQSHVHNAGRSSPRYAHSSLNLGQHTKRATRHAHPSDLNERPAKRARSEAVTSPQYFQSLSRPSSSHVPSDWSYNVEQMAEAARIAPTSSSTYNVKVQGAYYPGARRYSEAEDEASEALLALFRSSAPAPAPTWNNGIRPPIPSSTNALTSSDHSKSISSSININSYQIPLSGAINTGASYRETTHIQEEVTQYSHNVNGLGVDPPPEQHHEEPISSNFQTHTPPEELDFPTNHANAKVEANEKKEQPKAYKGWPKGKLRGSRAKTATSKKSNKGSSKAQRDRSAATVEVTSHLHSPQSLLADGVDGRPSVGGSSRKQSRSVRSISRNSPRADLPLYRRSSFSDFVSEHSPKTDYCHLRRACSVPPDVRLIIRPLGHSSATSQGKKLKQSKIVEPAIECAGCSLSQDAIVGDVEQWIQCDGCKGWFHWACAGFKTKRDVESVDKFICRPCRPKHGPTTYVRKSSRAHNEVDYAGLNEGVLRTSDDNMEHHYISRIKDGTLPFLKQEMFARIRPEMATAEYFERCGLWTEPCVIPAEWNPRPGPPGAERTEPLVDTEHVDVDFGFETEFVPDDGQDKLDMVIPHGLNIRAVEELVSPERKLEVINVKDQEGEDASKKWNMRKWREYYEQKGEKQIYNVISLEVADSKLGRLIRRPRIVRELDLQDAVWPEEDKNRKSVGFYCLMSVKDCYTDFHIDFGGSGVYYHIVKGKKTFFFIPPKKQNLKAYEQWCLSPAMNHTWLPEQTKECYRVDLSEGDTMLIPSGWIHSVWTPENSLVIGGNFLTRMHYSMQLRVVEVEKTTKVPQKFKYPFFQKVMWYALLDYLKQDPLPDEVRELFYEGKQFVREKPIYLEPNKFGHNSHPGRANYHSKYYSRGEVDGWPDLVSFLLRTVMLSMGRIEGVAPTVCERVAKSIPKGHGQPLDLIRTFAIWVAWKRGNEDLPQWAHPNGILPEAGEPAGEKKMSAAALKRLEKQAALERTVPDRQSVRQRQALEEKSKSVVAENESPAPMDKPTSTPKTSVLGPKRIACDACRRRRIRCKHKDELDTSPSSRPGTSTMVAVWINNQNTPSQPVTSATNSQAATPAPRVYKTPQTILPPFTKDQFGSGDGKRGRNKACLECRRSKRRCIHDEYGNIDPIRAQESPIPRGSANKKRASTGGAEQGSAKKLRSEPTHTDIMTAPQAQVAHAITLEEEIIEEDVPSEKPYMFQPLMTLSSTNVQIQDTPDIEMSMDPIDPSLEMADQMLDGLDGAGGSPDRGVEPSISNADDIEVSTTNLATAMPMDPALENSAVDPALNSSFVEPTLNNAMVDPALNNSMVDPAPDNFALDPALEDFTVAPTLENSKVDPSLKNSTADLAREGSPVDLVRNLDSETPLTNGVHVHGEDKQFQASTPCPTTPVARKQDVDVPDPSSPLSEAPSFPELLPTQSVDHAVIPSLEVPRSARQSTRGSKPVDRFTNGTLDHKLNRTLTQSKAKSSSPVTARKTTQGTAGKMSVVNTGSKRDSKSVDRKEQAGSPSRTEEEEASMKLAMQLQAEEFGLRRIK